MKNTAASVRDRLLALAKERQEDFNFILTQYAIQRLLYRLSISDYRDRFLLKGAWLFSIWSAETHRPTRDADFLGFGDNDVQNLVDTFKAICKLGVDDGLEFDIDSLKGIEIKEDAIYQGVRITGYTYLAEARIALQVDIAFGDVVTPAAEMASIPVFLDLPAPELHVYPVYTVIAEKFQAMVALGLANSRMKDMYDIWRIAHLMTLESDLLIDAMSATFKQRQTALEQSPLFVFSDEYTNDVNKARQWQAFIERNRLKAVIDFADCMKQLQVFLEPVYQAAVAGNSRNKTWSPESWLWKDE